MSNSWNLELYSPCGVNRRMSGYFMQPSPLADGQSPFNLRNIMSAKNVTESTMFDDKNNSYDLFASGAIGRTSKEDNNLSLVDHLPLYESDRTSFLVKSEDIIKSSDMASRMDRIDKMEESGLDRDSNSQ
jgi:hypothetical protein